MTESAANTGPSGQSTTGATAGANWFRCDLHIHSPFDPEKKFGEDVKGALTALEKKKPEELKAIAERFIESCRKAAGGEGIDIVAITDHNSIDGFLRLKPFWDELEQAAHRTKSRFPTILPGVEFTVGGERLIHILVVFPKATDPADIRRLIEHIFNPHPTFDSKTGTPRSSGTDINHFLTRLGEYCRPPGGDRNIPFLVIPAHAENAAGIARETGATAPGGGNSLFDQMRGHVRQRAITKTDWNGFQTADPYPALPEAFRELLCQWIATKTSREWDTLPSTEKQRIRGQAHWPLIEASDPHNYSEVGRKFTWLKLETLDVEGIRLALLDPESRLRRMSDGPPSQGYPFIKSVVIERTDFFESLHVPLNRALNTLIGGRGTGKTTFVESLRYGLDRDRNDDFEEGEEDILTGVRELLAPKALRDFGETSGTLLPDHRVIVDVVVAGRTYRSSRGKDGLKVTAVGSGGEPEGPDLDVRSLISPRILSQTQIARIARDAAAQRRELDAIVGRENVERVLRQDSEITKRIEAAQRRRASIHAASLELQSKLTQLKTVTDQIGLFETNQNQQILREFAEAAAQKQWFESLVQSLGTVANGVSDLKALSSSLLTHLNTRPSGPLEDFLSDIATRVSASVLGLDQRLGAEAHTEGALLEFLTKEAQQQLSAKLAAIDEKYNELKRTLKDAGVDIRGHAELVRKGVALKRDVDAITEQTKQLPAIIQQIEAARNELVRNRLSRLELRRQVSSNLQTQDADVKIEIVPFGDRDQLASKRELWFGGTGLQARDWDLLVDFVYAETKSPTTVPERLFALTGALRADAEASATAQRAVAEAQSAVRSLIAPEGRVALTGHFYNSLTKIASSRIDEMETYLPEDKIESKVRESSEQFKPIEQGSVGQRSTAVLALLLASGDQPLIIDQPETDLDNKYIYDVIVNLLRKRKFSRQIILSTHNANIPVNGDAELILAFGVANRIGLLQCYGSIDQSSVKEAVSTILEGSEQAFRLRGERYGF